MKISPSTKGGILVATALALAPSGAWAQRTSLPKQDPHKARADDSRRLNSPARQETAAFGESVLRSAPFPGTAAFGAAEDLNTSTLFFGDLYNATIYRFNKDLTPSVPPQIPGVSGTQVGLAWDPSANSLWVMDLNSLVVRELNKQTGVPTGRTLTLDPANSSVPAPMTIDPVDPDVLVYEDIATDTFARIRISTNAVLASIPNPCGSGAFGNGVSWAPGNNLDDTCATGTAGPGAMQIFTGNPLRTVCGMPYAFLPTSNIAAASGDSFVNEIQYSVDNTLSGTEVWYVAGNATNTIYEVGPVGTRPTNIQRFGAGSVGSGGAASCNIFPSEGFDSIPPGAIPLGWSRSSPTGNGDWGARPFPNSQTPPQSEFTTDVPVIKDDNLDSRPIPLPPPVPGQPLELRFWHTFALENSFDGVVLEASVNAGPFNDIGHLVTQNPPNVVISSSFSSPIAGRTAWSGGAIGPMQEVIANLDSLGGNNVVIRWRHADDDSVAVTGYFLDSVCVGRSTGCRRANVLSINRTPPRVCEPFDGIPPGVGSVPPGWSTTSPTGNGDWGASNAQSSTPPNAMFSSDVATVKDDTLITLPVDLRGIEEIGFNHSFGMEPNFDGCVLEVSKDNGTTWDDLGQFATENGYTGVLSAAFASPLAGRAAWTGSSGGFQHVTISLPLIYQADNSLLRFRLACDSSVSGVGWFVDDLKIGGSDGTGGVSRVVQVDLNSPITVSLDASPCGPAINVPYALFVWRGESIDPRDQIAMGSNLGCAVNKTPLNGPPAATNRFRCLRGGLPASVCSGWRELGASPPRAPWTVTRGQGFASDATFTLQAIIRDSGASNAAGFSVTNAVQLNVQDKKKTLGVKYLWLKGPAGSGIGSARNPNAAGAAATRDCVVRCLNSVYGAATMVCFTACPVCCIMVPADVTGDGNADFDGNGSLSDAEVLALIAWLYANGHVPAKKIVIASVGDIDGHGATRGRGGNNDNFSVVDDGGDCRTYAHEVGHQFDLAHNACAGNLMRDPRPAADPPVPGEIPVPPAACPGAGTASPNAGIKAAQRMSIRMIACDPQQLAERPATLAGVDVLHSCEVEAPDGPNDRPGSGSPPSAGPSPSASLKGDGKKDDGKKK